MWVSAKNHQKSDCHFNQIMSLFFSFFFTVFDPVGFLGPVGDLSQTVKEVVCFVQTQDLKETRSQTLFLKTSVVEVHERWLRIYKGKYQKFNVQG